MLGKTTDCADLSTRIKESNLPRLLRSLRSKKMRNLLTTIKMSAMHGHMYNRSRFVTNNFDRCFHVITVTKFSVALTIKQGNLHEYSICKK